MAEEETMRRRVFVIAGEYSAHPRDPQLGLGRTLQAFRAYRDDLDRTRKIDTTHNLFFRYPRRRHEWAQRWGRNAPVDLADLLGSACHRALCGLHETVGDARYTDTLARITDVMITTMPEIATDVVISPALIPQTLRAELDLDRSARCQFVVGTSDSGAWAFANAVRIARRAQATVLIGAGQVIPSGYSAARRIRRVLGKADQAAGLDMLAVGDVVLDTLRRTHSALSKAQVIDALATVRARKWRAASAYPAAMQSGTPLPSGPLMTPYYAPGDIAPACCGAASAIVTSDEALARQIASKYAHNRYARPPIIEVLGVGEGSSNPNVTHRRSPLALATPVAEGLAACAEDAGRPLDSFRDASFCVLHDAFPSIELSFLLAMGFSLDDSLQRMATGWPNPFGGLATFGHAIGASGLVQICKAFHNFAGDTRYVRNHAAPPGDFAFTTSVGGPLSHIVVSAFAGHADDLGPNAPLRPNAATRDPTAVQHHRRDALRHARSDYFQVLADLGDARYLEGTTQVDLRSCLHAISLKQLSHGVGHALQPLVKPAHVGEAIEELVLALGLLRADLRAGRRDVIPGYDAAITTAASSWSSQGWLSDPKGGSPEEAITLCLRQIKASLRLPLALFGTVPPTHGSGAGRELAVISDLAPFADVDFVCKDADQLRPHRDPALPLPPWHVRAQTE